MIAGLLFVTLAFVDAPPNDAMTREHLEPLLEGKDEAEVVQVFRRYPDDVLPFVDSYLEGGLKMIEEEEPKDPVLKGLRNERARKSFRIGVRFARLADRAFGISDPNWAVFEPYAVSFASWSPSEQKQFREGQREFRAGRAEKDAPAKALAHYEKSLRLAEPLGDSWGAAMAYGGIAEANLRLRKLEEARAAAEKATNLYHGLRLRTAKVQMLLVYSESAVLGNACNTLERAWSMVRKDDPVELRQKVLEAYCSALDEADRKEEATELRKQASTLTTQPASPKE